MGVGKVWRKKKKKTYVGKQGIPSWAAIHARGNGTGKIREVAPGSHSRGTLIISITNNTREPYLREGWENRMAFHSTEVEVEHGCSELTPPEGRGKESHTTTKRWESKT